MKHIQAPQRSNLQSATSLFLAGSIEMGAAEHWQTRVVEALSEYNVDIYNPRRDDWDSSWVQSIDNPQFNEQVTWELEHLVKSEYVIFCFDPNTKSPITLLELGYMLGMTKGNVYVVCPPGFWRKGNVDIICKFERVPVFESLDGALQVLRDDLHIFHSSSKLGARHW